MKVEIVVTSPWGIRRAREVYERLIIDPALAGLALAFLNAAEGYRLKRYRGRARHLYKCQGCGHENPIWDGCAFRCGCGHHCKEFVIIGHVPAHRDRRR